MNSQVAYFVGASLLHARNGTFSYPMSISAAKVSDFMVFPITGRVQLSLNLILVRCIYQHESNPRGMHVVSHVYMHGTNEPMMYGYFKMGNVSCSIVFDTSLFV